jgi:hypothetical protein
MVFTPIAFIPIGLLVWINEVPDWQKGDALAQMQFERWYLQPFYPDEEIALSSELARSERTELREPRRQYRPVTTEVTTSAAW